MRDRLVGLPVEGLDHPVLLDRGSAYRVVLLDCQSAFRDGRRDQVAGPPAVAERDEVDGLVPLGLEPLGQLGDVRGEHGPLLGPLERQGALRRRADADTAEHQGGHRGDRDEEQQPGAHPPVLQAGAPAPPRRPPGPPRPLPGTPGPLRRSVQRQRCCHWTPAPVTGPAAAACPLGGASCLSGAATGTSGAVAPPSGTPLPRARCPWPALIRNLPALAPLTRPSTRA